MLEHEVERVFGLTEAGKLDEARVPDGYTLVLRQHSFGDRLSYVPVECSREDLQDSRGISVDANDIESVKQRVLSQMELNDLDRERIDEVSNELEGIGCYVDVGFREPKLIEYYRSCGLSALGVDISRLNVEVARSLGYEAHVVDLDTGQLPMLASPCLMTCYHVLEHTPDPVRALRTLMVALQCGSLLHIEVPIEPGVPRLRFAHMSEFRQGDLGCLLLEAGMSLVSCVEGSRSNGNIERCLVRLP